MTNTTNTTNLSTIAITSATPIGDIATARLILGLELEKLLEANGAVTKKATRSNKAVMDMLFDDGMPVSAMFSPYDNSGKKLKPEAKDAKPIVLGTGTFTWIQVYDSLRMSIARGYCNDTEWNLYTMAANETATAAREVTRKQIVLAIQNKLTSLRKGVATRYENAAIDKAHEEAQSAEGALAKKEGRAEKNLPRSDFEPKKSANSKKDPRDAAGEFAINAIRRLTQDETPNGYDHAGSIAAFRSALVCLNVEDITLNADDTDNK